MRDLQYIASPPPPQQAYVQPQYPNQSPLQPLMQNQGGYKRKQMPVENLVSQWASNKDEPFKWL